MKRATQVCVCLHMCVGEEPAAKICGKRTVCKMYSHESFWFATDFADTSYKIRKFINSPSAGVNEDFYDKNQKCGNRLCSAVLKGSTSQVNTCSMQFKMFINPVVIALRWQEKSEIWRLEDRERDFRSSRSSSPCLPSPFLALGPFKPSYKPNTI